MSKLGFNVRIEKNEGKINCPIAFPVSVFSAANRVLIP